MVDLLEDIPLPKLSALDRDELEAPVRVTEILTANLQGETATL